MANLYLWWRNELVFLNGTQHESVTACSDAPACWGNLSRDPVSRPYFPKQQFTEGMCSLHKGCFQHSEPFGAVFYQGADACRCFRFKCLRFFSSHVKFSVFNWFPVKCPTPV